MFMIGGALKSFKFNILAFIIGFIVGICYIYQKAPELVKKVVYPTPFNAGKITYKNSDGECFQYIAEAVTCPENTELIKNHTIIDDTPDNTSSSFYDKVQKMFKI